MPEKLEKLLHRAAAGEEEEKDSDKTPTTTKTDDDEADKTSKAADKDDDQEPHAPAEAATEEGEEDGGDFLAYVRDAHGEDLADKYKTPEEAIKGLVEAYRLVGKRDEDANYGRALKTLLGGREKDLASFLAGATQPTKPARSKLADADLDDFPEDADTWAHQIRQDDAGKLVPVAGAPSDIVERYQAYQRALEKRVMEIARSWPKLKTLPDELQKTVAGLEETTQQAGEQAAINQWQNQYREVLFVGGDPTATLTAEGLKVAREYERLVQETPTMSRLVAFRNATRYVLGSEPKQKAAATPSPHAHKKAGVAVDERKYKNLDEEVTKRIEAGESLEAVMTDVGKKLGASELG